MNDFKQVCENCKTSFCYAEAPDLCPQNKDRCCLMAALNGHLDCLKYAHEKGCRWDEKTCENAALNGHLECLQYAHDNGCPWDEKPCTYAELFGHKKCLGYVHENGCPCKHTQ